MKIYDNTNSNHVAAFQYFVKSSALYVDEGMLIPLYAEEAIAAFPTGILVVEGTTTTVTTALATTSTGCTLTVGSKTFNVPKKPAQ